ncbi:copper ion binding protein [Nonomuraea thailandensis]|uniref:Copper ion binding protein n=2 Tax=Nonomuraea thailandensis TaxID=1188745 RepID=A0A9X2GSQ6_9ACTN|nr:copper ion binding protein [Nonomuraea thailandensis]
MTLRETTMSTATYTVHGMTCGHCVSSVKEEVSEVAGVTNVEVDLASGLLTVDSDGPVERARIAAAVEDAGYELADRS